MIMKSIKLAGMILLLGLAVSSKAQVPGKHPSYRPSDNKTVSMDPVPVVQTSAIVKPLPNPVKSPGIVTVLTLGTAVNGLGWGYNSTLQEHLWVDNDLNAIVQTHRSGPGSSPPGLSGYFAMDHAGNRGLTLADWSINYQVYASTLNLGGTFYADAARYPQGALYNPPGNTSLTNSYFCFFAPNLSNETYYWGGYSYGRGKWGTQSDSTKHLNWYNPPPRRYVPSGFTIISQTGKSYAIDIQYDFVTGLTAEGLYLSTGTWNSTTNDFDYSFSTINVDSPYGVNPLTPKIQADPSGSNLWISFIGNNGGATPVFDSVYYPVLFHSSDGGQSWSSPISITLDGADGIPVIRNFISDYRLSMVYSPNPVPPRDQIPYTTAFDADLTVDQWGNPHIITAVGLCGSAFSLITPDWINSPLFDSTMAVFDIYSVNSGSFWCARMIGIPKHFRGYFPSTDYYEDLRSNISRNSTGDKIFYTYNDTWANGAMYNNSPDIFARGWDLVLNKLTNNLGQDAATNATYLSDVTQQAFCGDQAQQVFTTSNGYLIPMICESLTGNDLNQPVTFKYISNFTYSNSDFTIDASGPPWGTPCTIPTTEIVYVTSPNGFEKWPAGTVHNITWAQAAVDTLKIEYSTDNGSTWNMIATDYPAVSGSFPWTIPDALSDQCLVKITDLSNPEDYDISDCVFQIAPYVGIGDQEDARIRVYPNPSAGIVNFYSEMPVKEIFVFNSEGIRLSVLRVKGCRALLDLSDYGKGVYLLKINTGDGDVFRKVVIL
jgi:hypothetical protein